MPTCFVFLRTLLVGPTSIKQRVLLGLTAEACFAVDGVSCHLRLFFFSIFSTGGESKHSVHPPFLDIFPAWKSGLHFFSNCRIFKSTPVRRLLEIRVPTWAMKKNQPPSLLEVFFLWGIIHAYTSLCYGGLLYPIVEIWVPTLAAAVRSWTR